MLDIYVWSIEDTHTVRIDGYGVRIEAACFTDRHVAHNFRRWLAGLPGLERLMQHMTMLDHDADDMRVWQLIATRRMHPAQVYTGMGMGIIQFLEMGGNHA